MIKTGGIGDLHKVCVTKEGLALSGYDPTSYFDEDAQTRGPLPGKTDITAEHNTANYQFATGERQKNFLANPEKFAPAFGGFCAKAVSENDVYWVNPETFLIQDSRLLMFYNKDGLNTADFWLDENRPWDDGSHKDGSDSATRLAAAEKHWQAGPIPVQQEGGGVQPSTSKAGGIGDLHKVCVTKEGLALSGYDPTSYFDEDAQTRGPLPGKTDITAQHNTATYQFATVERQKNFLANPEKFAPAFGGFCAKAVSENDVYWVNPETFLIQDGRLLMFYNKDGLNTADFWLDENRPWDDGSHKDGSDSATRLAAAEKHWQAGPIPVQQEGGGVQPSE